MIELNYLSLLVGFTAVVVPGLTYLIHLQKKLIQELQREITTMGKLMENTDES